MVIWDEKLTKHSTPRSRAHVWEGPSEEGEEGSRPGIAAARPRKKKLKEATQRHRKALLQKEEEEAAAAAAAAAAEEEPEYRPTYNVFSIANQVSAPLPAAAMTTHRLPPPHCCA